jgi:hypothetical protein
MVSTRHYTSLTEIKKRNLLANTVLTTNCSSRNSDLGRTITATWILDKYGAFHHVFCDYKYL